MGEAGEGRLDDLEGPGDEGIGGEGAAGGDSLDRVIWRPQAGPQALLLSCPVRDVFFGGARGGGKSDALLGDAAAHCHRHKKWANAYLFRRTYPELEELIDRAQEIYPPLGGRWTKGEKMFVFRAWGGSRIRFRYLERDDDAMVYQGKNITYVGIDELGNFQTAAAPDKLWGAMRSAHGVKALFRATGNPGGPGHGWIKERYIDPVPPMVVNNVELRRGIYHQRVFIPSFLTDNQLLMSNDPAYIDRLYLVGAPWLVRAWLEGDWNAKPEGHFFDVTRIQYGTPHGISRVYIGLDPATRAKDAANRDWKHRDHTVIVTIGIDDLNRYWLLDVVKRQMDTAMTCNHLFRLHGQWREKLGRLYVEGGPIWRAFEPWFRDQMRTRGTFIPVEECSPISDKGTRATPFQTVVNAGGLYVPTDNTPWLADFLSELSIFDPVLAAADKIADDQVDAASWVFLNLRDLRPMDASQMKRYHGGVGQSRVVGGQLSGRDALDILRDIDTRRREREALFDPSRW